MAAQRHAPLTLEHRIAIGATMIGVTRDEYRRHYVEAGEKWCPTHRTWHPRTEDYWYTRPAKVDGFDTMCRETVRARSREGMRRLYARRKAPQGQTNG